MAERPTDTREPAVDRSMEIGDAVATPRGEEQEAISVLDGEDVRPRGPDGTDAGVIDLANEQQADLVPDRPGADDFLSSLDGQDDAEDPEDSDEYGFSGPVTDGPDDDPFALDEDDGMFGGVPGRGGVEVPHGVSDDPAALDDPLGGAAPDLDPVLEDMLEGDDRLDTGLDVDAPDAATPDEMTGAVNYYPGADNTLVIERTMIDSLFGADVEIVDRASGDTMMEWEQVGTTDDGDAIYEDEGGSEWSEDEVEQAAGADIDNNMGEQLGEAKNGLINLWNWAKSDVGPDAPTGEGPGGEYDPNDPNWQAKVAAKNGDIDGGEWDPNLLDDSQTRDYDGVDYGDNFTEPDDLPDQVLTYDPFVDDGAVDPIDYDDIGPDGGDGPLPVS